uniref:Uncharacterized protein n=1 Tax=Tetranychus urticae TaxID=32264 RepID=T1KQL6_TETUR
MSNLWFFRYPGRFGRRSSARQPDCLNLTQLRTPSIASTASSSSRHTLNRSSFQTDISRRDEPSSTDVPRFSSSSYIPPLRRRTLPPESTLKSTDSYDNLAFTPRCVSKPKQVAIRN